MQELTVIIVNYNSLDYLLQCLASVLPHPQPWRVVIVDNASSDQHLLSEATHDFECERLLNSENIGFAQACNQAIERYPSRYFLLLNPDVIVHQTSIQKTLDYLKTREGTGIVGCRVLNPDGTLQRACRRSIPTLKSALYHFSGLGRLFPHSREFGHYNLSYLDSRESHPVEAVSGSFLMFRGQLLESIGLMDERFFLYGEDLDMCYRALRAGWSVEFFAGAEVTHLKSRSSNRESETSTFHFYDSMRIFYTIHYASDFSAWKNRMVFLAIELAYRLKRIRQRLSGSPRVASRG